MCLWSRIVHARTVERDSKLEKFELSGDTSAISGDLQGCVRYQRNRHPLGRFEASRFVLDVPGTPMDVCWSSTS